MAPLIQILVEAYNKTLDFSSNVVSKFDDEKYAKAVTEMYGREPTFSELDAQIEIIKDADDIPTEKKIDLLKAVTVQRDAIRDKEVERRKKSAEIVDKGMEKKGDIAVKVAMGVLTGGVSLLPDAVNAVKGLAQGKDDPDDEGDVEDFEDEQE